MGLVMEKEYGNGVPDIFWALLFQNFILHFFADLFTYMFS